MRCYPMTKKKAIRHMTNGLFRYAKWVKEILAYEANCIAYGRSIRAVGVPTIRLAEIRNGRGNAVVGNDLLNGS
jgi:hypothetical protein